LHHFSPHPTASNYRLACNLEDTHGTHPARGFDTLEVWCWTLETRAARPRQRSAPIAGAVQKFEGQISLFNLRLPDGSRGPNYRDLFPEPPPPGAVPSCAEGGVLGVLPGVIGTMQATEAIKLAIGVGERAPRDTLSGRLLLYNAMSFRFHEVALKPRPNAAPIRELIDYTGFCGQAAAEEAQAAARAAERFARITPLDANERMQGGWEPFVLDVRTAREAEVVSLPRVGA